ncbi:MAG: hypothetical protein CMN32_04540 [Saprospirales bacterium]|nr:hypothetical protein [Saprospirales bacterium]
MRHLLLFVFFLGCAFASQTQTVVVLPENPVVYDVPDSWRGHNQAASANMDWVNNAGFQATFPKLHAGPLRWPFGNEANNFDWQAQLGQINQFNLKNAVAFIRQHGASLQMVVNFGNGTPESAADFVRFCNSTDTYWQTQRQALLEDPNPIGVTYWEIGNEVTDAWGFAWSWLGWQSQIKFRCPDAQNFPKEMADSLYYYGGSFWRQGWVEVIGGLTPLTAILGTKVFTQAATDTLAVPVDFPQLDTADPQGVRVWLTPNFDLQWAKNNASQCELYDSLTNAWNALQAGEFSWTDSVVYVHPQNGVPAGAAVLVEYNSINHAGAFAFRDAMKAADPAIQIGYATKVKPPLADDPAFQADFAASPPDFMVEHNYPSNLSKPLAEGGYFSEVAYLPVFKKQGFLEDQAEWDQRESSWGIPNDVGFGYTEWNIALCDECPANHEFDGIASSIYVAGFWANMLESVVSGDLDIRTINHFGLQASGTNFIHLFHVNNGIFSIGNEGYAALMAMESIGRKLFPVDNVSGMPQISILNQQGGTQLVDALQMWGGVDPDSNYYNLLVINRDDEHTQALTVQFPASWQIQSAQVETLYADSLPQPPVSYTYQSMPVANNSLTLTLPRFSLTVIKASQGMPLPVELLDFSARFHNGSVQLDWIAGGEENLKDYSIERQQEGAFELIGRVAATEAGHYRFTDSMPPAGILYYRLRQNDFSGSYSYSPVVAVQVPETGLDLSQLKAGADHLSVSIYSPARQGLRFSVCDLAGRVYDLADAEVQAGSSQFEFGLNGLPAGIYFFQVRSAAGLQLTQRFWKP